MISCLNVQFTRVWIEYEAKNAVCTSLTNALNSIGHRGRHLKTR